MMYLCLNCKKIKIVIADNFFKNLKGFMFKKNIDYCMRFKCSSIHTFFMLENIDIIQTDKNNKVIRYYKNFKRNRIILPKKGIYYTYELPQNTINTLEIGDILQINYF